MKFIVEWELKGELIMEGKNADKVAEKIDKMPNQKLIKRTGQKYISRYFTITPVNKPNPQDK